MNLKISDDRSSSVTFRLFKVLKGGLFFLPKILIIWIIFELRSLKKTIFQGKFGTILTELIRVSDNINR